MLTVLGLLPGLARPTVCARRESAIRANSLQYGFLGVGAAAFMDAFTSWTGKEEDIPFGVQEGTLWRITLIVGRLHTRVAHSGPGSFS